MKNLVSPFIRIIFLFLFLVSVIGITAQTSNPPALTPKQVAQRTLPSIVILVINNGDSLPVTTGSGFFVDENTIITNYHVVKNARLLAFKIYGSDEVYSVIGTVGIDSVNDLALLKVKGVKGKPLKLNGAYQLSIGDDVFTASSPKGLEGSFSQGLISGLRKTSKEDLIQITAPISHGSSGGAILNNQAEVIAVAVGGIDEGQSLNFAVPIKYAQALMAKKVSLTDLPGKIDKPYGNNQILSDGMGSGGGQNTYPTSGSGNGRGSRAETPTTIINENLLKAPSAVSEIIKSRIPPPTLKPNQFKVPDLVADNLRGDVFGTLTTDYKAISNFDKFTKGEVKNQFIHFYNRDGNSIDSSFNDYQKTIWTYNLANRIVTIESRYEGKLLYKVVDTYNSNGEQISNLSYNQKGELESRDTFEYSNQFSIDKSCSADNSCSTIYSGLDESGNKTTIEYTINNSLASIETTSKEDSIERNVYYFFCDVKNFDKDFDRLNHSNCLYAGKATEIVITIREYDPQTKQVVSQTTLARNLNDPSKPLEKESYKYEYKYDSKGNWIEKIERKETTKFGKTYFEPVKFIERQIKYYSDPDAKPSVNKKSTVKRKKN